MVAARSELSFPRALRAGLLAGLMAATGATAFAADDGPLRFPVYRDAGEVWAQCEAMLDDIGAQAQRLAAVPTDALLPAYDRLVRRAEDTAAPLSLVAGVHPKAALREAAEACELRHQRFISRLQQDATLHARLQALQPADAIDAQLRLELLARFEDAGVGLAPAQRLRARELSARIGQIAQDFNRSLREDRTRVAFSAAELDGVPARLWRPGARAPRGPIRLPLDAPTYAAVMQTAHSGAARERMWRAYQNVGGLGNLRRLARIAEQRRAYAALFGLTSYAEFSLRRRMAQRVERVQGFLDEVGAAVAPREQAELDDLAAAKAHHLGLARAQVALQRWDIAYYGRRLQQERHALDAERLRRHFPPQASVDFVMALAARAFDIGFKPLAQPLWHAQARAYEVVDPARGRTLGTLYLDLYPRPDKYGHAAVWPLRGAAVADGRLPAAALVTNLDRDGLTLPELETLLHEFGHALHSVLSTTRYAALSGTNVKLDFVEAPSQMLEEWLYEPRVLALMQQVCAACEPLPAELLERSVGARAFGKGIDVARQHLYASYDLALHGESPVDPQALWAQLEGATPLGHRPGTMFPAGFEHLTEGYGAGYYAYLWSLATAQDLYTAFAADPLDPGVGRRYRDTVLAPGGEVEPDVLVTRFLGRAPGHAAFFDWLKR